MNNTSTATQTSEDKLKNTEVSILSGALDSVPQVVKLIDFLPQIGRGAWREQIEQIREVFAKGGKKACSGLKKKLTAIQFAGVFGARTDAAIVKYSQLICIDIDEVEPHQIEDVFANLQQSPSLFCLFRSPTGGLKAVLYLGLEDPALHSTVGFNAAVREIGRLCPKVPVDKSASKNLERLCFVSWDPSWYVNWDAVPLAITAEDMQPKEPRRNGAPEPGAQDTLYSVLKACGLSLDPDIDKTSHAGIWQGHCLFRDLHENEDAPTDMRIHFTRPENLACFHESCRAAREELSRRWRDEIRRQETSVLLTFIGRIKTATRAELLNAIVPEIKASRALSDDDREVLAHEISQCKLDLGGSIRIPTARELVAPKWTDAEIQERRQRQEKMDRARNQWTKGWYYSVHDHCFVRADDRKHYDERSFNLINTANVPLGKSGRPENTATAYVTERGLIPLVAGKLYEPLDDSALVTIDGNTWLNLYTATSRPTPAENISEEAWSDIEKIKRHILAMANNDSLILDWFAHQVQNPGVLLRFAPLISGPQGIGKNTLEAILRAVLGELNVRVINNDELGHKWTGWANEACVGVFSEVKIPHGSRYEIANRLKSYITDQWISIERKGSDAFQARNRTNYIAFTNFPGVIPADEGERRWWHIHIGCCKEALVKNGGHETVEGYFGELYAIIAKRTPELVAWMLTHRISKEFRKLREAPMTLEKAMVIAAGKDSIHGLNEAAEILKNGGIKYVTPRVLSSRALFDAISENYDVEVEGNYQRLRILDELGFVSFEDCRFMWLDGRSHRIYVHRILGEGLTSKQVKFIFSAYAA